MYVNTRCGRKTRTQAWADNHDVGGGDVIAVNTPMKWNKAKPLAATRRPLRGSKMMSPATAATPAPTAGSNRMASQLGCTPNAAKALATAAANSPGVLQGRSDTPTPVTIMAT